MTARPSHPVPVGTNPGQTTGARSPILPGARALTIIRSAIAQRKHLVAQRVGQLTQENIATPVRELEVWLSQHNAHVSKTTLADFWRGHLGLHLRTIMPSTVGGANLLREFQQLCEQ